nr:DUF285 domain-containing protein [Lachnospiraceae bacterium]
MSFRTVFLNNRIKRFVSFFVILALFISSISFGNNIADAESSSSVDSKGYLLKDSGSLSIQNDVNWYLNYNYVLDDETNTIIINEYTGNESDIYIPNSAEINGRNYTTVINCDEKGVFENNINIKNISFENGVIGGESLSNLFNACLNLESITFNNFDTSNVVNMNYMFSCCQNLRLLDLSDFSFEKVTNAEGFFEKANIRIIIAPENIVSSLNIELPFDMIEVKEKDSSASACSDLMDASVGCALIEKDYFTSICSWYEDFEYSTDDENKKIILRRCRNEYRNIKIYEYAYCYGRLFKTEIANEGNSQYGLFEGFSSIKSIEIEEGVEVGEDLSRMFYGCSNLSSVRFSGLNTSNVKNMCDMFCGCKNLCSIDFKNIDTSNVETMEGMFKDCSSLERIDVSEFDTSNVLSMISMFEGCENLTSVDVSVFDTSKVMGMGKMFAGCSSLLLLDLSAFSFDSLNYIHGIFDQSRIRRIITPSELPNAYGAYFESNMYEVNNGEIDTKPITSLEFAPVNSELISGSAIEELESWYRDY